MKQWRGRNVLRALFTAAVVGVGGVALAQAAEQVWVNRPKLDIRATKGPVGVVATAKKGEQLTVIAREDNWLKVRYGDKEGYVLANSISAKAVKGGQSFGDTLAGGSDTSGMDTGAAGKGLRPEAEDYAKAKNLDPKVVEQMMQRNRAITPAEWTAFAKEGNVGPERKK